MHKVCMASMDRLYNGHNLACSDLKMNNKVIKSEILQSKKQYRGKICDKTHVSTVIQKTNVLTAISFPILVYSSDPRGLADKSMRNLCV